MVSLYHKKRASFSRSGSFGVGRVIWSAKLIEMELPPTAALDIPMDNPTNGTLVRKFRPFMILLITWILHYVDYKAASFSTAQDRFFNFYIDSFPQYRFECLFMESN